eukprot:760561-Hanusia_phi.AAC.2
MFDARVTSRSGFTVPKLGPQRKKATQEEQEDAPKPARKMSMPKFGEVKPKAEVGYTSYLLACQR